MHPEKRKERDAFYIDNLTYSIGKLLDKLKIDKNFVIITDNLPISKNKQKQIKGTSKSITNRYKALYATKRFKS